MEDNTQEEKIIEERKQKLKNIFLGKNLWVIVALLIALVLGIYIRSLPMSNHTTTQSVPTIWNFIFHQDAFFGGRPGLWDVTTNTWTLGPDLDPFLFLRYAKEMVNGGLPSVDMMRNVPLGFETSKELQMVPYMIVLAYKALNIFGSASVDYAAVIMPVIFFALTILSFFLFVREIFSRKNAKDRNLRANIIAIVSTVFMIVIPDFLPRTIAGIPEKESVGFFFMFLTFYLFLKAWKSEKMRYTVILGVLAAISTALMGLTWGGVIYIYASIAVATLVAFILNKVHKKEFILYGIWIVLSPLATSLFTSRLNIRDFITSLDTGLAVLVLFIMAVHFLIWKTSISKIKIIQNSRIPKNIISLILAIIVGIALIAVTPGLGPSFIFEKVGAFNQMMFHPITGRWDTTVAENRQPYFTEWGSDFGPYLSFAFLNNTFLAQIPIVFLLFVIGSAALFRKMLEGIKNKDSWILTCLYVLLMFGIIFSRYASAYPNSPSDPSTGAQQIVYALVMLTAVAFCAISGFLIYKKGTNEKREIVNYLLLILLGVIAIVLLLSLLFPNSSSLFFNGDNFVSKLFYYGSALLLIVSLVYYYLKYHKEGNNGFEKIDFEYLFLFALFVLCLFTARSAVRLVMVLGPIAPIFVSFLAVFVADKFIQTKGETRKIVMGILAGGVIVLVLFSSYTFYQQVKSEAYGYVPSDYTQQWQKAMEWVRNDTPTDAVFAHWWDYGYWVQSMGDRATVTDGGNAIVWWNYLTGRYVLTGDNQKDALNFLYAHNATYLLIDSSDIGKYGAYSQIGSDKNFDRLSYIPTLLSDSKQMQETKDGTIRVYQGGYGLDEDITYNENGSQIFLPSGNAALIGIVIESVQQNNSLVIKQPQAIFYYQGSQIKIPLRYASYKGQFFDFKTGLEGTADIIQQVIQSGQGLQIDGQGAVIYISPRVMKGMMAQVYLLNDPLKNFPNFQIAHVEQNLNIAMLNSQNASLNEFTDFVAINSNGEVTRNDLWGPIKIWSIKYNGDEKVDPEELRTSPPPTIDWQF